MLYIIIFYMLLNRIILFLSLVLNCVLCRRISLLMQCSLVAQLDFLNDVLLQYMLTPRLHAAESVFDPLYI